MAEGLLFAVTPSGAQFDVKFNFDDRVLHLKRELRGMLAEKSMSCLAMRLVHGIEDLEDDQVVGEGLQGATITLIASPAPVGRYVFQSSRFEATPPPAGRNTTCKVEATFHEDATFRNPSLSGFLMVPRRLRVVRHRLAILSMILNVFHGLYGLS